LGTPKVVGEHLKNNSVVAVSAIGLQQASTTYTGYNSTIHKLSYPLFLFFKEGGGWGGVLPRLYSASWVHTDMYTISFSFLSLSHQTT